MQRIKTTFIRVMAVKGISRPNESGQSLIIFAFVFVSLLALLGLAVDLGLVYVERVRVKRTVDAATLAAVFELPIEEAAVTRAIELIDSNGYNLDNINVYVAGCVRDTWDRDGDGFTDDLVNLPAGDINNILVNAADVLTPTTDPAMFYLYNVAAPILDAPNFYIDTRSFQSRDDDAEDICSAGDRIGVDASEFGGANKIRVSAESPVRMNFMQFFGFSFVTVPDSSVAENAANLDIVLALDSTGSMEYDTICYGCWERCDVLPDSVCKDDERYKPYPTNGRIFPFPYPAQVADSNTDRQNRMLNLIVGSDGDGTVWPPQPGTPKPEEGNDYIIIEAEFYSDNLSAWDPALRPNGQGYWAIQRQTYPVNNGDDPRNSAMAIDGYGYEGFENSDGYQLDGLVRHHPMSENSDNGLPFGRHYTRAEAESNLAPSLEYDFYPTWDGSTYVHFKAQWYNGNNNKSPDNEFFWAIYNESDNQVYPASGVKRSTGGAKKDHWYPRPGENWAWIAENTGTTLPKNQTYTLKIWAGSGGYAFDRFIITARDSTDDTLKTSLATPGTAQRLAADPCNPIFGLIMANPDSCTYTNISGPTDNGNNPLFDAINPMRGAQEAIRNFVARLDPELDQVGFVDFDSSAGQVAQMECLRASRNRPDGSNAPGSQVTTFPYSADDYDGDGTRDFLDYDEYECSDPTQAAAGSEPIGYTLVFKGIEDVYPPGGGTDIAGGLWRSLHMLGITTDNDGNQANNCEWKWTGSQWQIRNADGGGGTNQPAGGKQNPSGHCSRGAAATSIIVLLTDGAPTDGSPGDNAECKAWGENNPLPYVSFPNGDNRYECIMYYADIAADRGVIVYTIGLGAGADPDLLKAVAETTRGQYYFAPSASQLDQIFDQILGNVYVRLVQ